MPEADIESRIQSAVAAGDQEALDRLLSELYEKDPDTDKPFDAAIRLKPDIRREIAEVAVESDAALNWANRIGRAKRWLAYQAKTAGGFKGIRIVEEGDSWFQYPLLLDDTIDQLSRDSDKAIFSLSGAGDLLEDMADRREYLDALRQTGARILLISGGGNDMLGGGRFANYLLTYSEGNTGAKLLNLPAVEAELTRAVANYRRILAEVKQHFPAVKIIGHAYDLPYPQPDGKWIGKPLAARGIPLDLGRGAVEAVLDRFSERLSGLQEEFPSFRFLDLRGKVGSGPRSWFDELHPLKAGYGRAAEAFRQAIAELSPSVSVESDAAESAVAVPVTRSAPGVPLPGDPQAGRSSGMAGIAVESSQRVIVLDPGHGGSAMVGGSSPNNAIGPRGTLEKTLTLDIATRAQAVLTGRGNRVHLTRSGDVNPSLAQRAGVAKTHGADAFISIHFNASEAHNAQGTETFVHTNHSGPSRKLCVAVQKAMVNELGLKDRNAIHSGGVKLGGFGVLSSASHAANTGAVLLEVSFMDRADEEQRLLSEDYRDRIAAALARGIETYLNSGAESFTAEADEVGIGDAIELGASEAGMTPFEWMGLAERPTNRRTPMPDTEADGWIGGHELVAESSIMEPAASFAQQIAESLARDRMALVADGGIDIHEFADVDPGPGFDVSALGFATESDTRNLRTVFAGVESAGFDMRKFEAFIGGLGLSHFHAAEFLFLGNSNGPGRSCAGKNGLPPEEIWPRIAQSAKMIDEIRKKLGARIDILSCYRNAAYNGCVGGERNSLHMGFNAIDWTCAAGTVAQWHQAALAVRAASPQFAGGIGRYDRQRFIHIDTRGRNADWNG